jgi:hypothetical protein
MSKKCIYLLTVYLALVAATGVHAATVTVGPDADTYVADATPHGDAAYVYIHDTQNAVAYLRFDLSSLNILTVQNATLTMVVSGGAPRNDNLVTGRFALHGLNNVAGNTPQDWDEAPLSSATDGAEWTTNGGDPLVNTTNMDGTVAGITEAVQSVAGLDYWVAGSRIVTVTGDLLVSFIQDRVDDNGMVTFLVMFPDSTTGRGIGFASKEFETEEFRPKLELEVTVGARTAAVKPSPADKATDILRDTVLSWDPGVFAATHNVYFSTDKSEVESGSAGALVAEGHPASTYDPAGHLAFGQTYYWRIDEVNGTPDATVYAGPVWSFTVEPVAYPLTNVTATASTTDEDDKPPVNTVNGSGLSNGQHSTLETTMWKGTAPAGEPVWIQFEFDGVYKLHQMQVWNYNMGYEYVLGFGVKDVTIEYAADANEWKTLGDYQIARATSRDDYTGMTIDMGGAAAKYVRLNIHNSWTAPQTYGLSEVAFSYIPVYARQPQPVSGAADVDPAVTLSWRPGRDAASHLIYFGADEEAVADNSALLDTVTTTTYDLGVLELGTTYYWRIGEVNEAETPSAWVSGIWNFSTPQFVVVDDFESYTDDTGNLIYETWADGYEVAANGSQVGYEDKPYAERTTVHGGNQSMPFHYGMDDATTSEATLTFETAQDWTTAGVKTLVIYWHGNLGNAPGQLYVKINGTKINFNGSTAALAAPLWKQWSIDLASLGNTAKSVKTLLIGVSGSGSGLLYVDNIRLYKAAPEAAAAAVDPGTTNLVALYAMEDNLSDSTGNGRNGTAETGSSFAQGLTGYGKALVLDGASGYATLPIGTFIQSANSITVATWVNWAGTNGLQRIFDFGSGESMNMWMAPNAYGGLVLAITSSGYANESRAVAPATLPRGWHHVAITIDGATSEMNLYLDGRTVDTETTATLPSALGNTTQNWIGRSQYAADPYFNGSVDDFRIYNRALSAGEVRYLVGDR